MQIVRILLQVWMNESEWEWGKLRMNGRMYSWMNRSKNPQDTNHVERMMESVEHTIMLGHSSGSFIHSYKFYSFSLSFIKFSFLLFNTTGDCRISERGGGGWREPLLFRWLTLLRCGGDGLPYGGELSTKERKRVPRRRKGEEEGRKGQGVAEHSWCASLGIHLKPSRTKKSRDLPLLPILITTRLSFLFVESSLEREGERITEKESEEEKEKKERDGRKGNLRKVTCLTFLSPSRSLILPY